MAEKKREKEALNVEEAVSRSEAFIIKYKNYIMGALLALILIVAGVVLYKNYYAAPREQKAQAALFKGETYIENDSYELALNGDSIGYKGLLNVINNFGGTHAANLAKAYAGICYAHLGKYEEAIGMLDKFKGNDQMVAPAIKGAVGNCYAQLGKLDKAASTLISAAKEADNASLSPVYLQQAGQILYKLGKYDDAIKAYKEVKDKYFRSYVSYDIDKYIDQAELAKQAK